MILPRFSVNRPNSLQAPLSQFDANRDCAAFKELVMGVLRKLAYTTVGGGALLLVGGGLTYRRRLQENKSVTAVEFNAQQDQEALKDCLKHLRDGTLPPLSMYRYTT
jgi:hypothetical protein